MKPEQKLDIEVGVFLRSVPHCYSYRIESSHTAPGFPDRVIFWRGKVILLELKAGTKLTPCQKVFHRIAEDVKIHIYILEKSRNNVILDGVKFPTVHDALRVLLNNEENNYV